MLSSPPLAHTSGAPDLSDTEDDVEVQELRLAAKNPLLILRHMVNYAKAPYARVVPQGVRAGSARATKIDPSIDPRVFTTSVGPNGKESGQKTRQ